MKETFLPWVLFVSSLPENIVNFLAFFSRWRAACWSRDLQVVSWPVMVYFLNLSGWHQLELPPTNLASWLTGLPTTLPTRAVFSKELFSAFCHIGKRALHSLVVNF
jgi:hypothetical protein